MAQPVFFTAGSTEACQYARSILQDAGISFTAGPDPTAADLLLDVPSFSAPDILRSGKSFSALLPQLPSGIRIWGGKLPEIPGHPTVDLLKDTIYVKENAAITADCAVRLCGPRMKAVWQDTDVLVIGWGRIGKQLSRILRSLGSRVAVCARKEPDRALLTALGYQAISPDDLSGNDYQVIFNTAPAPVMDEERLGSCPLPIDLASQPGLTGKNVLTARGLPGIYAPETSGKLIAKTILRHMGR